MKNQVSKIDQRILQLKQKKEKIQTNQAVTFFKESQKILGENFSPDLALFVLSNSWKASSDIQKKEWEKNVPQEDGEQSYSFRKEPQNSRRKDNQAPTENTQS